MAQATQTLPQLTKHARRILELYTTHAAAAGTRPWGPAELAQGFVGDVGDLMKLTMAKEGFRPAKNLDAALAHELADCLWSILLVADAHQVDLEKSFLATMTALERKLTAPPRTKTARKSPVRQDLPAPKSRSVPRSGS